MDEIIVNAEVQTDHQEEEEQNGLQLGDDISSDAGVQEGLMNTSPGERLDISCCFAFFRCSLGPCAKNRCCRALGLVAEILVFLGIITGIIAIIFIVGKPGVVCSQLNVIDISGKLTVIKKDMMPECASAEKVVIGLKVQDIEYNCFDEYNNIVSYEADPQNEFYKTSDGVLLGKKYSFILFRVPVKYDVEKTFKISGNTSVIYSHAFYGCQNIDTVMLHESIESIDEEVFTNSSIKMLNVNGVHMVFTLRSGFKTGVDNLALFANDFDGAEEVTVYVETTIPFPNLDRDKKDRFVVEISDGEVVDTTGIIFVPRRNCEILRSVNLVYIEKHTRIPFGFPSTIKITVNLDVVFPPTAAIGVPTSFINKVDENYSFSLVDERDTKGNVIDLKVDTSIASLDLQHKTLTFNTFGIYLINVEDTQGFTTSQTVRVSFKECFEHPTVFVVPDYIIDIPEPALSECVTTEILVLAKHVKTIHKYSLSTLSSLQVVVVEKGGLSNPEFCDFGMDGDKYIGVPVIRCNIAIQSILETVSDVFLEGSEIPIIYTAEAEGEVVEISDGTILYSNRSGYNFFTLSLPPGKYHVSHKALSISFKTVVCDYGNNFGIEGNHDNGTLDFVLPYGLDAIPKSFNKYTYMFRTLYIPPTVKYLNQYDFVTGFDMKYVEISGGTRNIGAETFRSFGISTVIIPGSVDTIERAAFSSCQSLVRAELQEGITSIGSIAFSGCLELTYVDIPSTIKVIMSNPWIYCDSLNSIRSASKRFVMKNSYEFVDGEEEIIITFLCGKESAPVEYVIPEYVKTIGSNSFSGCERQTTFVISSWVKDIQDDAFRSCYSLSVFIIEEGVTRISGEYIFISSTHLTQLTIPHSLWSDGRMNENVFAISSIENICYVSVEDGDCDYLVGENLTVGGKEGVNTTCSKTCPNQTRGHV